MPGWEYGNFVTNEVWASAYTRGVPNTWTETGQIAGAYKGCCSVWWFYAFKNGTEGFRAFEEAPYTWEVRQAVGNNYGMKTTGGGVWCWYYAADWTLEACAADFAWVATELEAGGEIGSEEKPVFDASTNNSAEWMNGEWHTWIRATDETTNDRGGEAPGLCWSPLNGAPGNIYYDTCGK